MSSMIEEEGTAMPGHPIPRPIDLTDLRTKPNPMPHPPAHARRRPDQPGCAERPAYGTPEWAARDATIATSTGHTVGCMCYRCEGMRDAQRPAEGGDDPMPVFVIKAKDRHAVPVVTQYLRECQAWDQTEQAAQVRLALEEIRAWQEAHPDVVKLPDHKHVPAPPPSPEELRCTQCRNGDHRWCGPAGCSCPCNDPLDDDEAAGRHARKTIRALEQLHQPIDRDGPTPQCCQSCVAGYDPATGQLVFAAWPCSTARIIQAGRRG